MTHEKAQLLAKDEEVIAVLSTQKSAVKADIVRGTISVVFSFLILAMMLVLYFRGESASPGNTFIPMGVMASLMFLFGAVLIVLEVLQLKLAGMVLTPTRIVGYVGFPILKKLEILHKDNEGFQVYPAKRDAYFVRIAGLTAAYMENPQEFESALFDLVEKSFGDSKIKIVSSKNSRDLK